MFLLYHAYVYLEFLILACTIYTLAPQYNADAFEARGGADVKVGTAEKVSKVREDKAR